MITEKIKQPVLTGKRVWYTMLRPKGDGIMKKDWTVVELLRLARHDWLNKIQLIQGYLAMNNIEKVKEIIDQIVRDASKDSKLSNLGQEQFAALLLTSNWQEGYPFIVHYEIEGNQKLQADDHQLAGWFDDFFQTLSKHISVENENELHISIQNREKNNQSFTIEFYGIIQNKDAVLQYLYKDFPVCLIEDIQLSDEACTFQLILKS